MTTKQECGYVYHGKEGSDDTCTLTGRACLCVEDWLHCTRRDYALRYEAKHQPIPRQFKGVILTDAKGNLDYLI